MSEFFTKDEIISAQDLPYEDVVVPEWGGKKVRIQGLTAAEASKMSQRMVELDGKGNIKQLNMDDFMPYLLSRALVDENFKPIFDEKGVAVLGTKSAKVVRRLYEIADKLSGISDGAKTDAVKNSDGTPEGDSPTG